MIQRNSKRWLGIVAVAALSCVPVLAAPETEADEQEVVVTARRKLETRSDIAASTNVITREEIERSGARDVVDLLSREPGVYVSRQGGLGYASTLQLRGLGGSPSTRNLVLVDGHPDFMGIMGHSLPNAYLLDNVERIEVVRGPASVTHGGAAMGGLVHIITRPPVGTSAGQVTVEMGSFNTRNVQGHFGTTLGSLALTAAAGRHDSDGHVDGGYNSYHSNNFALTAVQRWSPSVSSRFSGTVVRYDTVDQNAVAAAFSAGAPIPYRRQKFDRRDFGLTTDWKWNTSDASLMLFFNPSTHRFEDGFHSDDYVGGLSWVHHAPRIGALRPAWGVDVTRYGGEIYSPAPVARDFARTEAGGYLSAAMDLPRGIGLSAAVRGQAVEGYSPRWLPTVGATAPGLGGTFRASYREGYRTPSFRELYLFGINNPSLRPERTAQWEIGYHRGNDASGEVDAAIFHTQARDLIAMGPRPATVPGGTPACWVNTAATTLTGGELLLRKRFTPLFRASASYSYLNPGAARAYNTGHKAVIGVDVTPGRLRWSSDVQWLDRLWGVNSASQVVALPSVILAGTRLAYALNSDHEITVGVENLFNKSYTLNPAYPYAMPGRAFLFTVRARR